MSRKVLILYYSQFGNTAKLASAIHRRTGADILRLQVPEGYFPENMEETDQVFKRDNKAGKLPPITTKLPDLHYYDTILIGGPVWDGKVSSPILKLLQMIPHYQGKVVPFSTGWSDSRKYQNDFIMHAGKLNVTSGYHVLTHGSPQYSPTSLTSWLRKL
ncbi:flavodoxin family protein [Limosilactobacillus fastidiosus]|uniref:Flavodoxin n=1 Tax=Limosilactobacillus fastidiosus TaxID=2759855 RepID=A0A7W3U0C3_9LACO|nr:flavodoxin [Limosilactobacillus fastidiosus]MBB1062711.1 flavodoxin [Limosilactobacillus fastidiosus]MBB1086554.1 flavodoxin [Limosilactobacillus fastidiosus]MCD7084876.1 flavodoxin [Limosilactobacillus fastidiosus]MCD7085303.1 flavodoxin [Limosilactobacillus fastidiosus]MCD7115142.1 flavodoxin [Limosilactobacillus fastidiosus]